MTRHPPEFQDTDPAAMEVWIKLLRKKKLGEKLAATLELSPASGGRRAGEISAGGFALAEPRPHDPGLWLGPGSPC
jgi:hypothetical protein